MNFKHQVKILSVLLIFISIASVNAQQNLAQQAYAIFEQSCLICHGENGAYRESLIIEHTALIDNEKVVPGDPEGSVFYQRLIETDVTKRMPQGQPPLDPAAIETIRQWILAGAPDWDAVPRPDTSFISTNAMLETIENHVNSLSMRDKSFARYFTLTHLYNAGETTETLNAYRRALSKLINSLSWGREIVKPQPIDVGETVFYIDLRDFEWDVRNDAWTQIEQVYPYQMTFDAPTQTGLREKLTGLQQETNSEVPFIHVDWFLATASLPPLYYDILQLPLTERVLEEMLEVSVIENVLNAPGKHVWRAGFNDSGVSNHNRVVERHTFQHGAYWKSYDFASSVGTQNIFTHPISFEHDGSEIIFNLPNGLQAYYLVDGDGIRLDVAPTDIVSNPAASDPAVRNGLSCIGCHTEGIKTFEDEVRATVEQADNPLFNKESVLALYVEKKEMDAFITQDTQRFREALEATGGVFGGIEPVQRSHEAFQAPLDATHAAASLGLQTEILLEKIQQNVDLQNLGLLVLENGTIKRDVWTQQWTDIVHALNFPQESIVTPVEPIPEHTPGTIVNIPDPALRREIVSILDHARWLQASFDNKKNFQSTEDPLEYQITVEEMATLTDGLVLDWDVQDLEGLQFATGLKTLFIANTTNISDISPLAKLTNLEYLEITGNNNISDISPLAGLTNLEHLEITGNNNLSDISPLSGLTNLEHLEISGKVSIRSSPGSVSGRYRVFHSSRNEISDISPLAGLTNLETLSLYDNNISDLLPLAGLTALKSLNLNNNNISDVLALGGLTNLQSLSLGDYSTSEVGGPFSSYNNISDISPLAGLTALKSLNLSGSNISDFTPLEVLPKFERLELEVLDLSGSNISDVSTLRGVTRLKSLRLNNNNISDISGLAELTELERLYLDNNSISDISGLAELTELERLYLDNNNISDLTSLANLTELDELSLSGNNITDLSPLAGLTALSYLSLARNNISDVFPLAGLTALKKLHLSYNNISDISPLKAIFAQGSGIVFWNGNPGYSNLTLGRRTSISGPWLRVVVPGNFDAWRQGWKPMANASDGAVTEADIAATGATEGTLVGANVWVLDEGNANWLNEQLENLGIEKLSTQTIVYGCTFLDSPRDQETTLLIPSGYYVKAWLNEDLLHSAHNRIQVVPITLKKGKNILLFGVSDERMLSRSFAFPDSTEFTVSIPGVAWTLSHSPINAGDTFTLDLSARNVIDFAEWQFDISFDPTALEVLEVNEGDFMKQNGGAFFQKGTIDNTAGKIEGFSSAILTTNGVNGTGVLLSVTFKAKTEGEKQVALHNFQFLTISREAIPAGPDEFIFTIMDQLIGDVNRDGRVSIQDMILVSRVFGKDASDYPFADINQDGKINIQDLIIVAQHIGETTDSAAAPIVAMDSNELTPAIVQAWIQQAQIEDDGSLAFRQGIENLQKLLATLLPEKTALLANYPNPFNPETWIPYHLSKPADVTLTIYAANGAVVRTLTLGHQAAGIYQRRNRGVHWDGKNEVGEEVASGIYFYTLIADDFTSTRKLLIRK